MIAPDLAAFLEGGASIHIATRDASLRPTGSRAAAVEVDDSGEHVTVFVPTASCDATLANLRDNGQAAVSFGGPSTDRAFQVKGVFVDAAAATAPQRTMIDRQWAGFLDDLARLGFPRQAVAGWVTWPATAIRLRVTAVFAQTPGPGAGAPLP